MPLASKKRNLPSRKIERIEARLHSDQRRRIEHAAALKGTSISDFIVSSADEVAKRTIQEHESWTLSSRDSEVFMKALLNPPPPSPRLRAAVRRYKAHISPS
ncbi:MAG TPA: DUF1778 domain-containing protein [Candidatus Acidoferrales bacterium]|nr:DUF1778 domain-containing protein [Candidatus Acidoferrales bacterium]